MGFKEFLLRRKILLKVLNFFGIHIPEGKRDLLHFSPRFLYIIGFFFLFLLLCAGLFVKFSTSSYFCGTCHIMKPYYRAWKNSTHNFVPCVDCHYPPGFVEEFKGKIQASAQVFKYITRTYGTKPYAEIEDSSCLRKGCHSRRLLEGRVKLKKGVVFDHRPHLLMMRRGRKLRCTSCHSQIVVGSHIAVTESVCFICHFKPEENGSPSPIGRCDICHTPPEGEISLGPFTYKHEDFVERGVECTKCHFQIVQGKGEVPREMCLVCHGEEEKLKKYNDHPFIHDLHVTERKVECFQCHTEITHRVSTDVAPLKNDCFTCHFNMHEAQYKLYSGTGGFNVEEMPSIMYTVKVDCGGCHIAPSEKGTSSLLHGSTLKPAEAACLNCHGKEYEGVLAEWRETVEKELRSFESEFNMARRMIKTNELSGEDLKKWEGAIFNYNLVKIGKGVHNVEYATALLDKARSILRYLMDKYSKNRAGER